MPNQNKENWVDYKELKARVNLEMVLNRYGVFEKLTPSGANLVSVCPIHKGSNPRQFSVNLERSIWNCFGNCKVGGNVIDFVAKMEDVSFHEAALLLQNWFLSEVSPAPPIKQNPKKEKAKPELVREEKQEKPCENLGESGASLVNAPLAFELRSLSENHKFFSDRGIAPATVKHFGLGFCSKGILKDRIAIPIHDEEGHLVAYCGRAVTETQTRVEGKYKLPPNFVKQHVVYNLNRQEKGEKWLIVVESFLSVFQLHQAGYPNTVALMGSVLGEHQEELLVNFLGSAGRVVLVFDSDDDGKKCTADCLCRLGRTLSVKGVDVGPYGRKPHQLSKETLHALFSPYQ